MEERAGPGRFKCKFTSGEDLRLTEVVQHCGSKNWVFIARQMPGRNPRQCRERWMNYINPVLDITPLSPAEDDLLDERCAEHASRWQLIVSFLLGRSKNFIKNHWTAKQKRIALSRHMTTNREQPLPDPPIPAQDRPDSFMALDNLFPDF
jgi:hypothetical protein